MLKDMMPWKRVAIRLAPVLAALILLTSLGRLPANASAPLASVPQTHCG